MPVNFCIPGLSNDMKIAVQTNILWGIIWYRSLDPSKKFLGILKMQFFLFQLF